MMYAGGKGELKYIDALVFASGANTQAGLNPVDVNKLNTFQQIVMYIFPMLSNPITLHGCVVVLRLYWFEKRFQGLVKEVRHRRVPLTRTKSKSRPDDQRRAEEGFNVADIHRVAPQNGRVPRVANDGVVLEDDDIVYPKKAASSSEDSESTVAQAQAQTMDTNQPGQSMKGPAPIWDDENGDSSAPDPKGNGPSSPMPTAITFADTVKRSDGIENNPVNFVQQRPSTDHIAILERQRNQDNEVLRIPGPRETEQGLGPTRLDENDEAYGLSQARTRDSRPDGATIGSRNIRRNATITIAEPEVRQSSRHEDIAEDAKAWENTLDTLRLRKPRIFNRSQNKLHEDHAQHSRTRPRSRTLDSFKAALSSGREVDDMPYLSYTPTIGRNSNFIGLTFEQREELGGIEYRSLRTLIFILISYYWGFQLVGVTFLLPYIIYNNHYGKIVTDFGIARTWWGFFTSNGAFNDVGFSLTPDSMISFRSSTFVLMVMWFFIIIGNTGFPVMLRFIIWVMSRIVPRGTGLWEELKFLLDHPRRCFTLLFPSAANWWLFLILIILNSVDLIFFIILDVSGTLLNAHLERIGGIEGGKAKVNMMTAPF
jgi:potassium uptake Trk family protein